jgi:hypothetical protein
VPLAATVGGLAAGAGSLAAAFGVVAGSGAAAFAATNDLKEVFAELREELTATLAAFGERFKPLITDAVDAIPQLAENILAATGDLSAFREALRSFGQSAFRLLPEITSEVFDLARRALPILTDGLRFLGRRGGDIFEAILDTTQQVAPLLLNVGQAFGRILPEVNAVGTSILRTLLPALERGLGAFDKLLSGDIQGGLIEPIRGLIDSTVQFLNSGKGQKLLDRVSSALFNATADAFNNTTKSSLSRVITAFGGALGDALRILSTNFEKSGLGEAIGRLAGKVLDVFSTEAMKYAQSDQFQKDARVIGGAIADGIAAGVVAGVKESFANANLFDLAGGAGFAVEAAAGRAPTPSTAAPGAQNPYAGGGNRGNVTVVNRFEGDSGKMEEFVEQKSVEVVEGEARRATRNSGGIRQP